VYYATNDAALFQERFSMPAEGLALLTLSARNASSQCYADN